MSKELEKQKAYLCWLDFVLRNLWREDTPLLCRIDVIKNQGSTTSKFWNKLAMVYSVLSMKSQNDYQRSISLKLLFCKLLPVAF